MVAALKSKTVLGLLLLAAAAGPAAAAAGPARKLPANTWVNMRLQGGKGITPSMPGWETLLYSPQTRRAYVYGDYHTHTTETQHTLMSYSFAENRWDITEGTAYGFNDFLPAGGHDFSRTCVDARRGWLIIPHCFPAVNGNGPYYYDLLARCGRQMNAPGSPGFGVSGSVAYAPDAGLMLGVHPHGAQLWDPVTRKRESLTLPKGFQRRFYYGALVYDTRRKCWFWFGGRAEKGKGWRNDLLRFDLKTRKFEQVKVEGNRPPGLHNAQMVYNEKYGVIMLFEFAPENAKVPRGHLWVFDPDAGKWTREERAGLAGPTAAQAGIRSLWTVYDSAHDLVVATYYRAWSRMDAWVLRYVPEGRRPLAPLPVPEPRRMEIAEPAGLDKWGPARCLNAKPDAPVVQQTGMAAGKGKAFLAWAEDQGPVYTREWDGSKWSAAHKTGSGFQPALAVGADGNAWLATWTCNWTSWLHVYRGSGSSWTNPWAQEAGKDFNKKLGGKYEPAICLRGKEAFVATTSGSGRLKVLRRSPDGKWSRLGSKSINFFEPVGWGKPSGSVSGYSLAVLGKDLHIAWDEHWINMKAVPGKEDGWRVFLKKWDAGKKEWVGVGGAANNDEQAGYATRPRIAAGPDGKLYLAYIERKLSGTMHGADQVFVKRLEGGKWVTLGAGSLNAFGGKGNAWSPKIAFGEKDLWVSWAEYRIARPIAKEKQDGKDREFVRFDRPQVFAARWDGRSWRREGSLNADVKEGSAGHVSLTIFRGNPVVAWAEAKGFGGARRVFARARK